MIFTGLRGKGELRAVLGSSLFIAGLMIAGAASVFPIMLYSTLARIIPCPPIKMPPPDMGWPWHWCGGPSR